MRIRSCCFAFSLLALPALLACPGPGIAADPGGGNPNDHRLILLLAPSGDVPIYLGQQGTSMTPERSIESSEPINWYLEGPGFLSLAPDRVQPLNGYSGGGVYYLPPATVPPGNDPVARVYYTTRDPISHVLQTSPICTWHFAVLQRPMELTAGFPDVTPVPQEITALPGEKKRCGARVTPPPFGFDPINYIQWTIATSNPPPSDQGHMELASGGDVYGGSVYNYVAPANVDRDFDVTLTIKARDPWFNLDPEVKLIVHVKKGP